MTFNKKLWNYIQESPENFIGREIKIDEFLSIDCIFDNTERTVKLDVFYYIDDSPKGYIDRMSLVMNKEQQRWLIHRFTEEEIS